MILYGMRSGLGSPWRVKLACVLKGIPYEYRVVDPRTSEEFSKLNPLKFVPVLETDDGAVIADSIAILEYLEETFPEKPLLPSDPIKRAAVRQVVNLIASNIQPLQNLLVLNTIEEKLGPEERVWWAHHWIGRGFTALEDILKRTAGKYCFGDEATLADVVLFPQAFNAENLKLDTTPFPTIRRIVAELYKLPAVQNTLWASKVEEFKIRTRLSTQLP